MTSQDVKGIVGLEEPVEIVGAILNLLSDKERDVIVRRFGLRNQSIDTLASIGDDYGVTRERVRQVQTYALKKMVRNANNTNLEELHNWLLELFKEQGDIISEHDINKALLLRFPNAEKTIAELRLACILNDDAVWEHNRVDFVPHFRLAKITFAMIKEISMLTRELLNNEGDAMTLNQLVSSLQESFKSRSIVIRKKCLLSALRLDRRITVNEKGVSLTAWRHVNPRTLYDKILFILNEGNEPLHFMDIAERIRAKHFDSKSVSVQAVHNELINNPLFILIGRGIYALKTWGYKEGTVSDVLESILEKKGPMHLHDLTQEVLQRRKVKPITVQINLNSKKNKFRRNREGLYELS